MDPLDQVLTEMDLSFVGQARHKILASELLGNADAVLLDLRTVPEVETLSLNFVHHLSVLNVPLHELPERFAEVPRERVVGLFCPHAVRAGIAYAYLRAKGYREVYVMEGGYGALTDEARPGKVLTRLHQRCEGER